MLFHTKLSSSFQPDQVSGGKIEAIGAPLVTSCSAHGVVTALRRMGRPPRRSVKRLRLSPVLRGSVVCLSVFTSTRLSGIGCGAPALTPEESQPAREFAGLGACARQRTAPLPAATAFEGLTAAVIDPYVNGVHVSLQEASGAGHDESVQALADRLVQHGAEGLSDQEVRLLLSDPQIMIATHRKLWSSAFRDIAPHWRRAVDAYRRPLAA